MEMFLLRTSYGYRCSAGRAASTFSGSIRAHVAALFNSPLRRGALHTLHEETLRWHKKRDALLLQLPSHHFGSRIGHPAGHPEAGVEASDRQAAKLFG